MSMAAAAPSVRPRLPGLAIVFPLAILFGAFLLFQVQPLISKFILPWFGGSPAVWTTCMLFFQVLLFGGYAYAHVSSRYLPPAVQGIVHIVLLLVAAAMLPIAPNPAWKPMGDEAPTLRILQLLMATVGLPYFVLSATGPLVQSWFARLMPGKTPYRLYALSNIGSLVALLSYPFLFEPMLSSRNQAIAWSVGLGLFVLLCGYCAAAVWHASRGDGAAGHAIDTEPAPAPKLAHWLLWLALPAFASMALLATTNHVCQDVAVIPFLWVVPLSLYLLSFIIAFDHERWYHRGVFAGLGLLIFLFAVVTPRLEDIGLWLGSKIAPPAAAADPLLDPAEPADGRAAKTFFSPEQFQDWDLNYVQELGLYFAALFVACMLCHGELVRLRPHPKHLTAFYLMISAGGALGGVFVSLMAPQIFKKHFEWQITLAGGLALSCVLFAMALPLLGRAGWAGRCVLIGLLLTGGGVIFAHTQIHEDTRIVRLRNFYGVVSVQEDKTGDPQYHERRLFNGSITHGLQYLSEGHRRLPTTYYTPSTGVGRAVGYFRQRSDDTAQPVRVGTIGLGVGTMASYATKNDQYRFYDINPNVIKLANEYFTYLKDCEGHVEVVLGDARLSLEREQPQGFHVLVLDAFSGDAIPTHLLTEEAFEIFMPHMAPDGAICVHITNRYLDLTPIVKGLAERFHLTPYRVRVQRDDEIGAYTCDWVVLARDPKIFINMSDVKDIGLGDRPGILWTDERSNLFEILLKK